MENVYEIRRKSLQSKTGGTCIILDSNNIFYFTGFMAHGMERLIALIVDSDKSTLITPALHKNETSNLDNNIKIAVWNDGDDPLKMLSDLSSKHLNFVEKNMPAYIYTEIVGEKKFIDYYVSSMRSVKDESEIESICEAIKISEKALELTVNEIHEGITELELASLLDKNFIKEGAAGSSFPTIVSFGSNAANPHHSPDNTMLKNNTGIVIDFGCLYNNYRSDETRTLFFGEPDDEFLRAYNVLKEAQASGCRVASPEYTGEMLDDYVRNIITKHGYGEYFIHRTGHGIGLDEHEEPFIDKINKNFLVPGNCITVEPGIYIPDKFGMRIEDTLIIREKKAEIPEKFTKELFKI